MQLGLLKLRWKVTFLSAIDVIQKNVKGNVIGCNYTFNNK